VLGDIQQDMVFRDIVAKGVKVPCGRSQSYAYFGASIDLRLAVEKPCMAASQNKRRIGSGRMEPFTPLRDYVTKDHVLLDIAQHRLRL